MLFVYIVFQTMLLNYFSCGLGSVNVVFFFLHLLCVLLWDQCKKRGGALEKSKCLLDVDSKLLYHILQTLILYSG